MVVRLALPSGAQITGLSRDRIELDGAAVAWHDRVESGELVLEREVRVPAGRIATQDYPRFRRFVAHAEQRLNEPLAIRLPGATRLAPRAGQNSSR